MEIAFEPYRKISFRSYLQYKSPEDLARAIAQSMPTGAPAQVPLRWSNGVLFAISGLPPTDSLVKELLAGHIAWDHVDFALMPNYVKEIKLPEKPFITFSVQDFSEHPIYGPFGRWLKEHLAKQ
jgi:hypothetical protein